MQDEAIKFRHGAATVVIIANLRRTAQIFDLSCSRRIGTHTPVLLIKPTHFMSKDTPQLVNQGLNALSQVIENDTYLLIVDLNLLENLNTNQSLNYIKLENNLLQLQERGQALEALNGQLNHYEGMLSQIETSVALMETVIAELDTLTAELKKGPSPAGST